ncbi:ABC transporter permease [Bacillus infantis]|uniref:ABC transporter permease n=1 Tax=Bacillus infantis TaxID=324767 RepID=UPI001CD28B5D|nr:ABC transporter permease [Bacillus infantis]MCA1039471.1 ABC transporter permease [Bacillus infantis]
MIGMLWGKILLTLRNPGALIASTIICMAFAYLTGQSAFVKIEIPIYSSADGSNEEIMEELNDGDTFSFVLQTEDEAKKKVAEGNAEAAVELGQSSYVIYHAGASQNLQLLNQYIGRYYMKSVQEQQIVQLADDPAAAEKVLREAEKEPAFQLGLSSFNQKDTAEYSQPLQSLFGFTLFFSIYTVAFTVAEILRDKQSGLWDRFILSPTSKAEMYLANLLWSFLIGYIQIVFVFLVFKFGAGIDFNGRFGTVLIAVIPYLFSIVALSIFLTGLVKTMSQFNSIIPLISVSFAMLGGAYWPIEIVSSELLVGVSRFIPITYGMEMMKGAVVSGRSITDMLYPVAILLLMGVILMGLGIRMIEKRHV